MDNKIICIGRQFGSGGHEIAVRTAEQLGVKVYEKDILRLACRYGELSIKAMEKVDEKAVNPYWYETMHEGNYRVMRGIPTSEALFALQSHEIKRIAARENCIFVGRCADYVLAKEGIPTLNVFISAPFEQRVRRKTEQEKLSPEKAKHLVKKMDKQRKKYYESYTKKEWANPDSYDVMIDTGKMSIEEAVAYLVELYNAF